MKTNQKYFLPFYGRFILHEYGTVEWLPNKDLDRAAEDQFNMNLRNGHFTDRHLTGKYTMETMT